MLLAISFILAISGCISLWLISHHKARIGWWVNLAIQALWIPYDIRVHAFGLITTSVVTVFVARSSLRKVKAAAIKARAAKQAAIHDAESLLASRTRVHSQTYYHIHASPELVNA